MKECRASLKEYNTSSLHCSPFFWLTGFMVSILKYRVWLTKKKELRWRLEEICFEPTIVMLRARLDRHVVNTGCPGPVP